MTLLGKEKKPTMMNDDDSTGYDQKVVSAIQNYFLNEVMYTVLEEGYAI